MVARLIPAETPVTLTKENHPENIAEVPEEKLPTFSLASTIGIGALCSLVGMAIGSMALSTSFRAENHWEPITLLPLVATAACFLGGWVGAFFHMCRSESAKKTN